MDLDLLDYIRTKKPVFTGKPRYHAADDTLIYRFNARESYAKRIDQVLTVFLSDEGDELTGVELKGVKALLRRLRSFQVDVHDHKVKLRVILLAYYSTCPPEPFRSHQQQIEAKLRNREVALV